jgi:hypothetical protein
MFHIAVIVARPVAPPSMVSTSRDKAKQTRAGERTIISRQFVVRNGSLDCSDMGVN